MHGFSSKKVTRSQGDTERLATRETARLELQVISRRLAILEKDLLADMERRQHFIESTMNAIQNLIENGHYEPAEKLHNRVSNMLEGRISRIIENLEFIKIND